jgi:hypothetical protein
VSDAEAGPAGFTLTAVTSNEPDAGLDQDDLPNDIQEFTLDTPDTSGQLRAERADTGTGRNYTLTYRGLDLAGNSATCSTLVFVPHNEGQPNPPVVASSTGAGELATQLAAKQAVHHESGNEAVPNAVREESSSGEGTGERAPLTHRLFLPLVTSQALAGRETVVSDESAGNREQLPDSGLPSLRAPVAVPPTEAMDTPAAENQAQLVVNDAAVTRQLYLPVVAR